ncbi:MAG: IS1634 family transposase, partial [Bacteroidetes bacterium]|nr:IS1634 family transposase [Bacteroidota bacterium]
MAYITQKRISGKIYYYAEQRVWKNGKSRREWQKYLGTIDKIIDAVEGKHLVPDHAILFELGGVASYLTIAREIQLVKKIDALLPKRKQGLSIGEYILIAAINRGLEAVSKRNIWNWFQDTALLNYFSGIKQEQLTSQRFWDHMNMIPEEKIIPVWMEILNTVLSSNQIDLKSISYDETNFYTFISTFNKRCSISQRGKNKQGRSNLRQVNYALFCSKENHLPLYFDVYQGNTHDSIEFKKILPGFKAAFNGRITSESTITIIFDKGNNSPEAISEIDQSSFHFIGSLKLQDHKELAMISNRDERFETTGHPQLEEIKALRLEKIVYGKHRTVILTFNQALFNDQIKTLYNDLERCQEKLSVLSRKLKDRAEGLVTKGKKPTRASVVKNVKEILKRQYMKQLFRVDYQEKNSVPLISYSLNGEEFARLTDTYLGKKILFSDNHHWKTEDIILAYHGQYIIENIFKETKDNKIGCWWPVNHWTDQKIKVHGLYCTITLLIRALLQMKTNQENINLSMRRLHEKLKG